VMYFLYILQKQIAPIFLLIGIGFILGRRFPLDPRTLSRLTVYALVPGFIFVNIYEAGISQDLLKALLFAVLFLVVLWLVTAAVIRISRVEHSRGNAMTNSVLFFNSGNMGIPLITLVFAGHPFAALAVSTQIMVLLVQNLSMNTLGFFIAGRSKMKARDLFRFILGIPALYALAAALIMKGFHSDATRMFFWPTLEYLKNGLIPVTLFALGVQLSQTKIRLKSRSVWGAAFLRLIVSPVLAFGLIELLGIHGVIAQVLLICSGLPTAVNTAMAAVEMENEPEFAAQMVMMTTLLCAGTLSVLIPISTVLFPV